MFPEVEKFSGMLHRFGLQIILFWMASYNFFLWLIVAFVVHAGIITNIARQIVIPTLSMKDSGGLIWDGCLTTRQQRCPFPTSVLMCEFG